MKPPGNAESEGGIGVWVGGDRVICAAHQTGIDMLIFYEESGSLYFNIYKNIHIQVITDFSTMLEVI